MLIKLGVVVKHIETGKKGVISTGGHYFPGEGVAVVYEGNTSFVMTTEDRLEVLREENAIPNIHKCGAGRGAECCIFLLVGGDGIECSRFAKERDAVIAMFNKPGHSAARHPTQMYPACMTHPGKDGKDNG